ncbi:hypothetical protein Bca4012_063480 [Brassica carinata]
MESHHTSGWVSWVPKASINLGKGRRQLGHPIMWVQMEWIQPLCCQQQLLRPTLRPDYQLISLSLMRFVWMELDASWNRS